MGKTKDDSVIPIWLMLVGLTSTILYFIQTNKVSYTEMYKNILRLLMGFKSNKYTFHEAVYLVSFKFEQSRLLNSL